MPDTDIGTGTSITFGTSGFAAKLIGVPTLASMSRPSIETSTMATTTAHTFMPGDLVDNGEIELEFEFDPSLTPPINAARETVTITFPINTAAGRTTAASWACSAFMTNYQPGVQMEERMRATATLKISGAITITAAT